MSVTEQPTALRITRLDQLQLVEAWSKADPGQRVKFDFPVAATTGAKTLSLAYAVLEPGGAIPRHSDSAAEELLLVLEGAVEVTLGGDTRTVDAGSALLLPARQVHHVRNGAAVPARTVHLFGSASVAVTFADPLMLMDQLVVGGYGA